MLDGGIRNATNSSAVTFLCEYLPVSLYPIGTFASRFAALHSNLIVLLWQYFQ